MIFARAFRITKLSTTSNCSNRSLDHSAQLLPLTAAYLAGEQWHYSRLWQYNWLFTADRCWSEVYIFGISKCKVVAGSLLRTDGFPGINRYVIIRYQLHHQSLCEYWLSTTSPSTPCAVVCPAWWRYVRASLPCPKVFVLTDRLVFWHGYEGYSKLSSSKSYKERASQRAGPVDMRHSHAEENTKISTNLLLHFFKN